MTAAIEAYEEAGLIGRIGKRPLGSFKHRRQRGKRPLDVTVFPFHVSAQRSKWPEKGQRKAIWLPAAQAARLVRKQKLKRLIARFIEKNRGQALSSCLGKLVLST